MQLLEFDSSIPISLEELDALLDDIVARLTLRTTDSSMARQERVTGIRFGAVGVGDESPPEEKEIDTETIPFGLREEAEAVVWVHEVLQDGGELPLMEAEAVVRSLPVAMHGDRQMMLLLLQLRQSDEYMTTHSLNVSVLSMEPAEWLELGGRDVRAIGVAGLLHDLGKVTIPKEILNKLGDFTEQEPEIMNSHSAEGARMILTSDQQLDRAAAVAYEHHIMIDGGGYPSLRYPRDCHFASKLVHVYDVYDALRTNRPYRVPWSAKKVLVYIEEKSGTEFDGAMAHAFTAMMDQWEPRLSTGRNLSCYPELRSPDRDGYQATRLGHTDAHIARGGAPGIGCSFPSFNSKPTSRQEQCNDPAHHDLSGSRNTPSCPSSNERAFQRICRRCAGACAHCVCRCAR